jgi:hypothetical protein
VPDHAGRLVQDPPRHRDNIAVTIRPRKDDHAKLHRTSPYHRTIVAYDLPLMMPE